MGRYTGPKERLSRREGLNLFLKGTRSYGGKDGMTRKPYVPGQHGPKGTKGRLSNYGVQLREKQKVKRVYGLREKQFRKIFDLATLHSKRNNLDRSLEFLRALEMRLDSVVYLLGLAPSRAAARQFVTHGHVKINGKVMSIPSYTVKVGEVIELKTASMKPDEVKHPTPEWLSKEKDAGKVVTIPERDQMDTGIRENLIVEFYSR